MFSFTKQCAYCQREDEAWLVKKATMQRITRSKHHSWLKEFQTTSEEFAKTFWHVTCKNRELNSQLDGLATIEQNLALVAISGNILKQLRPAFGNRTDICLEEILIRSAQLSLKFSQLYQFCRDITKLLVGLADDVNTIHSTIDRPIHSPYAISYLDAMKGFQHEVESSDLDKGLEFFKSYFENIHSYRTIIQNGDRQLILVCQYCKHFSQYERDILNFQYEISVEEHNEYSLQIIAISELLVKFCKNHVFSKVSANMPKFYVMAENRRVVTQDAFLFFLTYPDDNMELRILLWDLKSQIEYVWRNYVTILLQYIEALKKISIMAKMINYLNGSIKDVSRHRLQYSSMEKRCFPKLDKWMSKLKKFSDRIDSFVAQWNETKQVEKFKSKPTSCP